MLRIDPTSGQLWLQLRHSVVVIRPPASFKSESNHSSIAFASLSDAKGTKESIMCFAISPCGQYFAVATDAKIVRVFNVSNLSKTVVMVTCVKRAAFLLFDCFDSSLTAPLLYIADKGGDVMSVVIATESESQAVHVLGHLAMLTAIEPIPREIAGGLRCLATADADARIRISRLPNAYNIEAFCLGHGAPVLGLSVCLSSACLLSLSADGSLRAWLPSQGVELSALQLPVNDNRNYCHLVVSQQLNIAACVAIATDKSSASSADTAASELLLCRIGPPPQCSLEMLTRSPVTLGSGVVAAVASCCSNLYQIEQPDCLLLLGNNPAKPLEVRSFADGSELQLPDWLAASVDGALVADSAQLRSEFFADVLTYASLEATGVQEYLEGKSERMRRLKLKRRRQGKSVEGTTLDNADSADADEIDELGDS